MIRLGPDKNFRPEKKHSFCCFCIFVIVLGHLGWGGVQLRCFCSTNNSIARNWKMLTECGWFCSAVQIVGITNKKRVHQKNTLGRRATWHSHFHQMFHYWNHNLFYFRKLDIAEWGWSPVESLRHWITSSLVGFPDLRRVNWAVTFPFVFCFCHVREEVL